MKNDIKYHFYRLLARTVFVIVFLFLFFMRLLRLQIYDEIELSIQCLLKVFKKLNLRTN
jgi:hypothetical protein